MKTKSILSFIQIVFTFLCYTIVSCSPQTEISENVSIKVFNYPVLKGKNVNPLIRIQIENNHVQRTVECVAVNWGETNTVFITSAQLFYYGAATYHKLV